MGEWGMPNATFPISDAQFPIPHSQLGDIRREIAVI